MKSKLLKSILLLMVFAFSFQLQAQTQSPQKALNFNGSTQYVSGATGISTSLTAITIEAWVYHNTLPASVVQRYVTINPEVAVLRYDGSGGVNKLHFYIKKTNGSLYALQAENVLSTGTWMHVAGTYDGTTMKLYLNGKLLSSATPAGGLYPPSGSFSFSATGSEAFNGKMDEVSVWNSARTITDIREDMYRNAPTTNANLKNYWQFNDGSGTTLSDMKGTATGTLNNMTNANWVASTIPFATGAVNTQIVNATGTKTFTGTGLVANFTAKSGTDTIVASRIDTLPNVSPTGVTNAFNSQYWVINRFGTGTFTTNATFTVSEDITSGQAAHPSLIQLYKRSGNGDGTWSLVATATSADAVNNTATFNGITSFDGQYMVCFSSPPNTVGTALNFDGTNDYVDCGNASSLNITGAITIEAWINADTWNANSWGGTIVGKDNTSSSGFDLRCGNNGMLSFVIGSGGAWHEVLSGAIMSTGQWNYVAGVYDGASLSVYVNGVLAGQQSYSGAISVSALSLFLGNSPGFPTRVFDGKIDEVRIFNVARTQAQIQSDMCNTLTGTETGLVNYWQFNNGSGTTLTDIVASSNGTLTNMDAATCWVESYAMVVPAPTAATSITFTGFTANWTAPAIGTVTSYKLDVSTNTTFTAMVSGYNNVDCGNNLSKAVTGLTSGVTYYYRVRADKTSLTGTGANYYTYTTVTTSCTPPTITSQSIATQTQPENCSFYPITVTATGTDLTYQWYSNTVASNSGGTSLGSDNGAQTNSYTAPGKAAGTLYYYCVVSGCTTSQTSAISGAFISTSVAAPAGSGTVADPYRIATLDNLCWLQAPANNAYCTSNFIQTADINAAPCRNWNGGTGFSPIGTQPVNFKGHYHGKGNRIDSLYINRPGSEYVGFFGMISNPSSGGKSTIDSLGLTNVNITGSAHVGGLGGYAVAFNCDHCSVTGGSVTATNSTDQSSGGVGGMFGGFHGYTASNYSISHCFAAVAVSGQTDVGGFVGYTLGGYINQCYSAGPVSGTGYNIGGFCGERTTMGIVIIWDSSYYDIEASGQATGAGRNDNPAYNHLQGKTTAEMKTQATYEGWDFSTVWKISGSVNNGYPYFDYPATQISTATVSNIANNTATATGSINHIGALPITAHGFCWNTTGTPTLADAKVNLGATTTSADYSASINSFSHNTTYYLRAYAINANDTIYGNVVNFTTTNTPTGGTCMSFSYPIVGGDVYHRIRIPDNNSLDLTDNYSIEAWINPANSQLITGDCMLIHKGLFTGGPIKGYYLERTTTGNFLGLMFDDMVTADNILTPNAWNHIAAVNDNGTRHIYVNGVEYPLTGTPKTVIANSEPLIIGTGNKAGSWRPFYGKFDEISLWNTALSQSQIREHMHFPLAGTETGLVSYWQMDEGSGATVSDKMGINNGTIVDGGNPFDDNYVVEPDANRYWLVSTTPFGMGYSNTQVVTATGTNTFTNTGLAMNFTAKTGLDSIVVARIDSFPNINPTGLNAVFDRQYWAVHKYGNGTLTANLTFTISEGFTADDQSVPTKIKLYKRSGMADDSTWTYVASATTVDAATHQATFNGITDIGQFIIARGFCAINIPDSNFRAALLANTSINTNGDSEIQCTEAAAYTGDMDVSNKGIADMTGIEAFTNITKLYCSQNNLTNLNISALTLLTDLDCSFNQLTALNITSNTALINFSCANNSLTSLNLSGHPSLNYLLCRYNQLTSLDVTSNSALIGLQCNNNLLTSLNVNGLTSLSNINCGVNQLTNLDFSSNTGITRLDCGYNSLTGLNVKNGHNTIMSGSNFYATNNPGLSCIQVDDVAWSTSNWTHKDAGAGYSTNCFCSNPTTIVSQSTATQSQCLNGTFTPITVTATGANLMYQWYSNATASNSGGTLLGANNGAQTYSYTPQITTIGTIYYYCKVSGDCGTTQSSAISGAFIVNPAINISSQSTASQTQCLNGTFTPITVTATGTGLIYQWYSNATAGNTGGTSLGANNGAQTNSYTPQSTIAGTLYYYCVVSGDCGTPLTSAISGAFIVNPATAISSQSTAAQSQCLNGTFTSITVTATGINLTYQWYRNSTASTTGGTTVGTNSNSYTPLATTAGTLYYYCKVTGTCGTQQTSAISGAFIVNPVTTISSQSTASQTQPENCSFYPISVTATGAGLTYQWYSNTVASNSGGTSLGNSGYGEITNSYSPRAKAAGTLYFYCVVSGCGTSQTSAISGAFISTPVAAPAGSGTTADPYRIASLDNLCWLQAQANSASWTGNFIQTADINAAPCKNWNGGQGFRPIGGNTIANFTGTYNGKGHIIDSIYINHPDLQHVGFFGKLSNARIDSLNLSNVSMIGAALSGALAGQVYNSTISHCSSSGSVSMPSCFSGTKYIGGLIGYYSGGSSIIQYCYSSTVVNDNCTGIIYSGGLIGKNDAGTITQCYARGLVSSGGTYVGGFAGQSVHADQCYWDNQTSGQTSGGTQSGSGTWNLYGKSTAEMKTQSTYTDWDFTNRWYISANANNGYPCFYYAPELSTQAVTNIQTFTATANGTIERRGTHTITSYGVCYNTTGTPTAADSKVNLGAAPYYGGAFSTNLTGLHHGTTYYLRTYAINERDTVYGEQVSFTTTNVTQASTCINNGDQANYISVPNNSSLQLTNNYSIEVWLKPGVAVSTNRIIVSKGYNANGYTLLTSGSGNHRGLIFDGMATADNILTQNQWCHVAAVNNNGTRHLYVNGNEVPLTGTPTSVTANAQPLYLSNYQDDSYILNNVFRGYIEEVRLWNTARTNSQIRDNIHLPLTGSETGLVSYWQFDEGQQPTVYDKKGVNNGTWFSSAINQYIYIKSSIPFGSGNSNTQVVSTTGTTTFTNTGLAINFTTKSGNDTIVVARIDSFPNINPTEVDAVFDRQYWAVHKYGPGDYTANLTFTINENFTASDELQPGKIDLYTRTSATDDNWTYLASASSVSATNHQVTFNGLNNIMNPSDNDPNSVKYLGQYIIVREQCQVNIPDANFKAALLAIPGLDANSDGKIQCTEATAFTGDIDVNAKTIADMTGIEAFTHITKLYCSNNNLTSLNISALTLLTDLDCSNNQLTALNITSNTALINFSCANNSLTSFNVSSNPSLNYLVCRYNQLTSLDVSSNSALIGLYCNNNVLTSLNVNGLTSLSNINCGVNQLTNLDFSTNTGITNLGCDYNSLTGLNVKNGHNTNMSGSNFYATNNPGLSCIKVDNVAWSTTNWTHKDAGASYSTDCSCINPAISSQSTATQTQCLNGTFTPITVTATGTNLMYQWYSNTTATTTGGTSVGTNSNSYTPLATTVGTLYYYCNVSGDCGTTQTSAISGTFIVNPATVISSQSTPAATQCLNGTFNAINVTTTGLNITYQWYKNASASTTGGTSLGSANGASTNSYTPQGTTVGTLYYYCVVTGSCGTPTSNISGAFIVNPATAINSQSTATQTQGLNGTFTPITVTATGANLIYQWYSNATASNTGGTSLGTGNGANTNSYTPQATTVGTLYYYCVVTGNCGTTQTSAVSGAFITSSSQTLAKQGAGVTLIIHGWNPDGSQPTWMQPMANAIVARSGGVGQIGTITVSGTKGALTATCSNWNYNLATATSGEIVVLVNWTAVSNHLTSGITAQEVAAAIAPKIYQSQNSQPALSELPIHLIGHSRGGGMVYEIARLLGLQGIEVEQVTSLDPHPLTATDPQGTPTPIGPGSTIDTPIQIYQNILFADNYYQNIAYPTGQSVTGAYNRLWTSLPGGYHNQVGYTYNILGTNYNFSDHLNIILAYHGTIDLATPVSNGQATMTTTERAWFNTFENTGQNTGFVYSRDIAGNRKSASIPNGGNAIIAGYNNNATLGGSGARATLTWTSAVWPNVITSVAVKNAVELSSGTQTIYNNDALQFKYTYRSYTNASAVTFYLDVDRNPYNNNNSATIGTQNFSATAASIIQSTLAWTVSGLTSGTKYYVYAKINDGTHTRYQYLDYEFSFDCTNPTNGGAIAGDQTGNSPFTPATITSTANATGQTGTVEYKWQQSTTSSSSGFSDIPNSNAATYDPTSLTNSTWYKRLARVSCMTDWTGSVASNVVKITVNQSTKTLNVTAMLQEYYNSSTGLMNQTKGIDWNTGDLYKNFSGTTVDTVMVLIRKTNVTDPNNPCTIDTVFYGVNLNNNGLITISLSAGITGYHYIEIKHRNSIETWSDSVNFSTDTVKYDFYNHISQFAWDNGMLQDGTHAWIWGGDVNQNGNLESADATMIYVAANSDDPTVNNGYVICDIDGNGNLDSQDYGLAYNNANLGANVINPFSYLKKK